MRSGTEGKPPPGNDWAVRSVSTVPTQEVAVSDPNDPTGGSTPPPPPPPGGGFPPPPPPAGGGYPPPGGQAAVLADWPLRAQSALVDWFGPSLLAVFVQYTISASLGLLLSLAALGWALYQAYQSGETGQSMGKQMAGTRLVSETTGQNVGGGAAVGRYFVHIIDALICYIGFLFPLWDAKKQTIADKLMKTVVVKV